MREPDYDSWIEGTPPDGEEVYVDPNELEFQRQVTRDPNSSDWD